MFVRVMMRAYHNNQGGSITSAGTVIVLGWTPQLSQWGREGGNLEPALNGWGTTESHTVRTGSTNPPALIVTPCFRNTIQSPEVYIFVHSPEKHLSMSRNEILQLRMFHVIQYKWIITIMNKINIILNRNLHIHFHCCQEKYFCYGSTIHANLYMATWQL